MAFVPALSEPRWYIVQIGDSFDEIMRTSAGREELNRASTSSPAPISGARCPATWLESGGAPRSAWRPCASWRTGPPICRRPSKLKRDLRYGLAYSRPGEPPLMVSYDGNAPENIRFFDELAFGPVVGGDSQ